MPGHSWTETRWGSETSESGFLRVGPTDSRLAFYFILQFFFFFPDRTFQLLLLVPLLGVVQAAPESLLCLKKLPLGNAISPHPRPQDDQFLPVLTDLLLALWLLSERERLV